MVGNAHPLDMHIIMCPICEEERDVMVWRDGPTMWCQCPRCGYYSEVTEDDFLEVE